MAIETPAIDQDKLMAFIGQVVGELGATVNAGLIVIGDRLGLYRALAGAGLTSAGALADESSPAFVGGAFQLALGSLKATPEIESAFKSGAGYGWHEHDEGVHIG